MTRTVTSARLFFGMVTVILLSSLHNGAASSKATSTATQAGASSRKTFQCNSLTRHDDNGRFKFVCSSHDDDHDQSRRKVQQQQVIKQLHVTVLDMSNGKILCQDTTDANGYYQCSGIQANTVIQIVFTSLDGTSTAATEQFDISDSGNHTVSAGTSSEGVVFLDTNGNGRYDEGEEGDHADKRMPSAAPSATITSSPTQSPTVTPTLALTASPSSYPTATPTKSSVKEKPTLTSPSSMNSTSVTNVTEAEDVAITLSPTSEPTSAPSTTPATCENSPEVRQNTLFRFLSNITTANLVSEEAMPIAIDDGSSSSSSSFAISDITTNAQGLAFKWMLTTDTILPCPASEDDAERAHKQVQERFILATLYYATGGQFSWSNCGRTMTDGKLDSDLCEIETSTDLYRRFMSPHHHHCLWYGITCHPDGTQQYVTGIDLANNTLIGYFPPELAHLTDLTSLKLDNNRIGGVIPTDIGRLKNTLTSLDLDNNEMGGSLPDSLYDLLELERLDLNSNKFQGELSSNIGLMTNLIHIQLQDNLLDGSLPSELGNLGKLSKCQTVIHLYLTLIKKGSR
jgi:hypothetical protein